MYLAVSETVLTSKAVYLQSVLYTSYAHRVPRIFFGSLFCGRIVDLSIKCNDSKGDPRVDLRGNHPGIEKECLLHRVKNFGIRLIQVPCFS